MDFTWAHIFELINRMGRRSQAWISEQLVLNRSTITRMKYGDLCKPKRLSYKDIFQKIFVPNFEDPSNQTKSVNQMEQELGEMGFGGIIKDLDSSSCESFVVGLLKMADRSVSKDNTRKKNSFDTQKPQEDTVWSLPPISLFEDFFSGFYDFSQTIDQFLNIDPSKPPEGTLTLDSLIRDSLTFWGYISTGLKRKWKSDSDGTAETYQRVNTFIDALEDYLRLLKDNSVRPDAFPDDFHLVNGDSEIVDKINCHRERARNLFKTAEAAVYAERAKKIEQERASINRPGEYLPPEEDK